MLRGTRAFYPDKLTMNRKIRVFKRESLFSTEGAIKRNPVLKHFRIDKFLPWQFEFRLLSSI